MITINVQVHVDVIELATLALYFKKIGLYNQPRSGGVLGKAIELFVDTVRQQGWMPPFKSEEHAAEYLRLNGFPVEQIYTKFAKEERIKGRAELQAEHVELFGAPAKALTELKVAMTDPRARSQIQAFVKEEEDRIDEGMRHAFDGLPKEDIPVQSKEEILEMAAKAGMFTTTDNDDEFAKREALKQAKIQASNRLAIGKATKQDFEVLGLTEEQIQAYYAIHHPITTTERAIQEAENPDQP